eukprot:6209992-Pleurochrysis_carterae.AAC.4
MQKRLAAVRAAVEATTYTADGAMGQSRRSRRIRFIELRPRRRLGQAGGTESSQPNREDCENKILPQTGKERAIRLNEELTTYNWKEPPRPRAHAHRGIRGEHMQILQVGVRL